MVPCCIVFSLYSSWSLPFLTNHNNCKGCQAPKPKAALGYLSHLLVWHVVVDVVTTVEVAVNASPENERRMKFGAHEHKTCCNSGGSYVNCENLRWETSGGRSDLALALQTTQFLLRFHFAEIKIHPDAVNRKLQISARNLDRQCPNCSFSAKSIHEWNQTVAMDLYIGFTCLLMLPEELNVFGRLREVWWAAG